MEIRFLVPVEPRRADALAAVVSAQDTLERVLRWAWSQDPPTDIAEIVTQDEFTHDVLVPLAPGLVLVYDTT